MSDVRDVPERLYIAAVDGTADRIDTTSGSRVMRVPETNSTGGRRRDARVNAYPLLIDLGLPVLLAEDRLVPQFEHHRAVLAPAGCVDGVPEAGGELEVES